MSVLKWIFGLLRKLWAMLAQGIQFLVGVASSVVAWVVAGVLYLLHNVFDYVGDFFEGLFESAAGVTLGSLQVPPFARWLAVDVVALDVAWEIVVIYFAAWVLTRVARASFSCVRAILDVL